MAITNAVAKSFKTESLNGEHLAANTYKCALFTSAATLDKNTTAYAAAFAPILHNYLRPYQGSQGNDVSVSLGALGAGVRGTVVIRGWTSHSG